MIVNQTAKNEPDLKFNESRTYATISPRVRAATTGVPPRSRRNAADGTSATAIRAL
ncbi:hypothetical protein HanPI659440_Chr06g0232631 [Helianthus annuus]|nr:hypothetical protein HanPI659440_Chr06g0232631 [Helianthus annuus]